jgi:transposase
MARSYREGKKVRKTILWPLGKLSGLQVKQIRLICEIVKNEKQIVTLLRDLVVKETKAYLDIAVINDLWNQWELDRAFDFEVTSGPLPTNTIAKILTINRCTDPCSHYSVPKWAKKNALAEVLGIDLSKLNDDKIYYELDKIHKNKISIENHLFNHTYMKSPESYGFIDYDLTTSYFVGFKCDISAFGKGKIECQGRRQVLLGVLINEEGYPFKWDVFPGNTAEVKTLKQNINACKTRFKLNDKNVTIVFDRGIISDDNGDLIDHAKMKYISGMNRNQISSCGISLKPFQGLSTENLIPEGLKKYDEELYFQDNGVINKKRYITGFNPTLFQEDRKNREEKIAYFQKYLRKENESLGKAQRDRQYEATKSRIVNELKRLKIQKYYDSPILTPITVQKKLQDGTSKPIASFKIHIKIKNDGNDSVPPPHYYLPCPKKMIYLLS